MRSPIRISRARSRALPPTSAPKSRKASRSSRRQARSRSARDPEGQRAAPAWRPVRLLTPMTSPLLVERAGSIATLTLNRPDALNALDPAIAAQDASFPSAYRHLGLTPDGGLSYALPRLVGGKKAMEMLLLGERFGAEEALRLGLVNRVVPEAELERATAAMADALAGGPALATRNGKRLLRESLSQSLSEQLAAEAKSFGACAATGDFVEGVRAFLEKRAPRFDPDA